MPMHSKKQAQVGALLFNKASTKILAEYTDYNNVFLVKYAAKLLGNTRINKHAIKLEEGKQPFFELIYSLRPIELEILKTYIKTILANGFIQPFQSPAWALILCKKKPNKSLRFCIDDWGLINITI